VSFGASPSGSFIDRIEVDDSEAFARYQAHHNQNYGHMARVTFEPLFNLDAVLAPKIKEIKR
jgi:hypothetical protein